MAIKGVRMDRREAVKVLLEAHHLLSGVPEGDWIQDRFTDGVGKCCAIGHYTRLNSTDPSDYSAFNCNDFGRGELRDAYGMLTGSDLAEVNNSARPENIKKTVLEALSCQIVNNKELLEEAFFNHKEHEKIQSNKKKQWSVLPSKAKAVVVVDSL